MKINRLRTCEEKKAKETEYLARQLIGVMSKPGDFAGFLDDGASDPTEDDAPKRQLILVSDATTQPVGSLGRRRSNLTDLSGSPPNSPNRNGSTPKRSRTDRAPTTPRQTQSRISFKSAKAIPDRKKAINALEKENHTPVGSDIVKETPTDLDTEVGGEEEKEPPASNYGGTAFFTSTPRLGLEIETTSTGRIMGGIGSQYDDDTTMDF